MSVVKKIIQDNIERVKVDELLAEEYEQAGYGGITLTKTPLGTQINLFAMRPGRVIGKRGRAIKQASERLEFELGLPNPQITVVEVEVPELNPRIMAARIANALERGVHYRRALFWSLRRTMESGALGCEIVLRGKLRSDRSRYEKVSEGYIPKSGYPALTEVKSAVIHVKQKKGTFGVTVTIVPPDAKFPDKISLDGLPVIEYPEEEIVLPEGVEPDLPEAAEAAEAATTEAEAVETAEAATEAPAAEAEAVETPEAAPEAPVEEAEAVETPEAAIEAPAVEAEAIEAPEAQPESEAETPEVEVQPEPEAPVEETVTEEPVVEEPVVEEPEALPEEEKTEEEAQAVEPEEPAVQEPETPEEDSAEEQAVEEPEAPKAEEPPVVPEEPSPDATKASPDEGEEEEKSQESPEAPEETDAGEA